MAVPLTRALREHLPDARLSITEGLSDGWTLIYAKGPEGEQLEFVKALGPVKKRFGRTHRAQEAQPGEWRLRWHALF